MVNFNPFSAFFGSGDRPENLPFYNPLLHEPVESPAIHRRPIKRVVLISSGLLLVCLLVAIIGHNDVDFVATLPGLSLLRSKSPETLHPASRGVSAGVSEKANRQFLGQNVASFPWNNSMLSWQRTAFHFQPEENWMNGILLLLLLLLSLFLGGIESFLVYEYSSYVGLICWNDCESSNERKNKKVEWKVIRFPF